MASGFIGNEVPRKGLLVRVRALPPSGPVNHCGPRCDKRRRSPDTCWTYGVFLLIASSLVVAVRATLGLSRPSQNAAPVQRPLSCKWGRR